MTCFACDSSGPLVLRRLVSPVPGVSVCWRCIPRIAGLLRFGPALALLDIWAFETAPADTTVIAKERLKRPIVVTEAAEVAEITAQLDLAVAYRDMGLVVDAAREAGIGLVRSHDPEVVTRALAVLHAARP